MSTTTGSISRPPTTEPATTNSNGTGAADSPPEGAPTVANAFQCITEGSVEMRYPADQESTVFYNPVQVQNRDLSILMITLLAEERAVRQAVVRKKKELKQAGVENWKEDLAVYQAHLDPATVLQEQEQQAAPENEAGSDGLSILDALAASGLRSLRYWKEIPGVRHVTINDLDAAAVERAQDNLQHNQLGDCFVTNTMDPSTRPTGIVIQQGDAVHEMYSSRKPPTVLPPTAVGPVRPPWDVIDLDPYGSAAPFVDAAVQAIVDGGLLCVTCTDMAALGGSHPETAFGRYAGFPLQRASYLQEMALRILLYLLATTASKYGRTIRPRLSVGMNFYIRVFVTVHDDKKGVIRLSQQVGNVFQSTQCPSFTTLPISQMGGRKGTVYQASRAPSVCEESGGSYKVGGPLWLGPLHDAALLKRALVKLTSKDPNSKPALQYIATKDRLRGLLQNCADELADVPLFYKVSEMASLLRSSCPPLNDVRAALLNAGYRVSGYHKDPEAIKTDAPVTVLWDIMRVWIQKHPSSKPLEEGSVAARILARPLQILKTANFTHPKQGLPKRGDVARFPANPEANWGPKKAATGHKRKAETLPETEDESKDMGN
jgi:tRNA (guanine26-N2/guanine27-N2)-dimethyltransferase